MNTITTVLFVTYIFQMVSSLIHIGGGIGGGAGGAIGAASGLGGAISSGAKAGIGGAINGAESLIGGAGAAAQKLIHGGKHHGGSSAEFDFSDSSSHEEEHRGHGKNGRGIRKHSGIGSHNGILTPVHDLLGLTKTVCKVSYAGETIIERLGEFQLLWQKEVKRFDRNIVNYVTDNILLKAVDIVRKGYLSGMDAAIDAHIIWDRFIINSIIEGYRITKAPIRELFACY